MPWVEEESRLRERTTMQLGESSRRHPPFHQGLQLSRYGLVKRSFTRCHQGSHRSFRLHSCVNAHRALTRRGTLRGWSSRAFMRKMKEGSSNAPTLLALDGNSCALSLNGQGCSLIRWGGRRWGWENNRVSLLLWEPMDGALQPMVGCRYEDTPTASTTPCRAFGRSVPWPGSKEQIRRHPLALPEGTPGLLLD